MTEIVKCEECGHTLAESHFASKIDRCNCSSAKFTHFCCAWDSMIINKTFPMLWDSCTCFPEEGIYNV